LLRLLAAADMQLSIEWQAFVSSVQAAAAKHLAAGFALTLNFL
jgi:hypothetical protein